MKHTNRKSEYNVDSFFINRWSPRAFSTEPVIEEDLLAILEAAHWAPSCFNEQPWRFYVAKSDAMKEQFNGFLAETNKIWASKAPILIAIVSKLSFTLNGNPNRWNGFDSGTAWGYLTMEAFNRGYITHAMGGFNKEKVAEVLGLSEDYLVQAVVALGKHGDNSVLPVDVQEKEIPSGRKPLEEVVFIK